MKTVQVRHVPDETHAVLVRRAADAGRSLQEYLLDQLKTLAETPTVEELFAEIEQLESGRIGFKAAVDIIRAERDSR